VERVRIGRRLWSLALGELVSTIVFGVVLFGVVGVRPTPANIAGFAALAVLLITGAAYWLAKRRQIVTRARDLPGLASFRVLRVGVPVLLVTASGLIGHGFTVEVGTGTWPGAALLVFAVGEYVNYFHVQVSPGGSGWRHLLSPRTWPTAHLARDLAAPHRKVQALRNPVG
jgi:hypothetical protein